MSKKLYDFLDTKNVCCKFCNKSYIIFITFKIISKAIFKNITRRIENDRRIYYKQGLL